MNGAPTLVARIPENGIVEQPGRLRLQSLQRRALASMGALAFLLFVSATLIKIDSAVIAGGQLGADSEVKVVSHPFGGVIDAILVRDGDKVRRGQVLMRFDTAVTRVTAEFSGMSVVQLLAQRARLEAEQNDMTRIVFPARLRNNADPTAQSAMAREERLFAVNQKRMGSIRSQLQDRITQYEHQIVSVKGEISSARRQLELIGPEREGIEKLYREKLVTISRRNQLERTAVELEGSISSLQGRIAEARARIAETRQQMYGVDQQARAEAGQQIAETTLQLNQGSIQNAQASDQFQRSAVIAPGSGVVDGLSFQTAGSVVPALETIMRIVPDEEPLTASAIIAPQDIEQVTVGQRARVRLSALNAQTTPELEGVVTFVSAERAKDAQSGASYFRVRVRLTEKSARAIDAGKLRVGMPAEIFVQTGRRSILSYMFKPLTDQFTRAFRDN